MLNKLCPCCGRHCDLNDPHCERGVMYAETGVIPSHIHKGERHGEKKLLHRRKYHELDIDNKLIWNLRDMGYFIRLLSEGKGSQSRILIMMSEAEKMTQRELTERLGIQPGSASEVIGKLESAGLLMRTPSGDDRRTFDIQLTDVGILKAKEAVEERKQRHLEMFSCLSEEDKDYLLILLEKVNNDWRSRYGEKQHGKKHKDDSGHHRHHFKKD